MLARAGIVQVGNSWFCGDTWLCQDADGFPCDHPNTWWIAENIALEEAQEQIAAGVRLGYRLHDNLADFTDWGAIITMYNQTHDELCICVSINEETISTHMRPNISRRVQSMCRRK